MQISRVHRTTNSCRSLSVIPIASSLSNEAKSLPRGAIQILPYFVIAHVQRGTFQSIGVCWGDRCHSVNAHKSSSRHVGPRRGVKGFNDIVSVLHTVDYA